MNGIKWPHVCTTFWVVEGGSSTMERSQSETPRVVPASANSPSSRYSSSTRSLTSVFICCFPCLSFLSSLCMLACAYRVTTGAPMWMRCRALWWTRRGRWSTGSLGNGMKVFTVVYHPQLGVSGDQVFWIECTLYCCVKCHISELRDLIFVLCARLKCLLSGSMPTDYELYYGFTRFAIELNELCPEMRELLPPTDARFRPDQRYTHTNTQIKCTYLKTDQKHSQNGFHCLNAIWSVIIFIFYTLTPTCNPELIPAGTWRDKVDREHSFSVWASELQHRYLSTASTLRPSDQSVSHHLSASVTTFKWTAVI